MRRAWLTLALVAVLAVAGCIGSGEGSGSEDNLERQAQTTESEGGIQGVVTDEAVEPIQGATVTIDELRESTETAADGSFAFSEVPPGTYTLVIEADGYLGTQREVDIVADEVTTLDTVLADEVGTQPYMHQLELNGFLECSVAKPHATVVIYSAVAVCAVPNILLDGNATNDKFMFTYEAEPNLWQTVTEVTWEPNNQFAERMSVNVEAEGFPNNNSATFARGSGDDPIVLNTDRERIAEVVDNLEAFCEEGDDQACNRNYVEDGGPMQVRVFISAEELTPGVAFQQDYTLYSSMFYHAPACEGFSIAEDNQCPQQARPPAEDEDPYLNSGDD